MRRSARATRPLLVASAADHGPRTHYRDDLARTFGSVTASETSAGRHATYQSEPWVIHHRETASRLYDEIIAACAAAGFAPRIAQRTTRITTTISMVASGIGVALLPITQAQLAFGGAVYRELRSPRSSIPLAFAWRRDQTAPVLARFMTVVRQSASRRKVGS